MNTIRSKSDDTAEIMKRYGKFACLLILVTPIIRSLTGEIVLNFQGDSIIWASMGFIACAILDTIISILFGFIPFYILRRRPILLALCPAIIIWSILIAMEAVGAVKASSHWGIGYLLTQHFILVCFSACIISSLAAIYC